MNMPSQFLVNREKNALKLSLSGPSRSWKQRTPCRKSTANSRLSCADLTSSFNWAAVGSIGGLVLFVFGFSVAIVYRRLSSFGNDAVNELTKSCSMPVLPCSPPSLRTGICDQIGRSLLESLP